MLGKLPRIYWASAIIVAIVVLYLCSDNRQSLRGRDPINPIFGVPSSRFSGAETIRDIRLRGRTAEERHVAEDLIAELKKLIEQNGLPADVFVDDRDKDERDTDDPTNIAITLRNLFHAYYDKALQYDENEPNDLQKLWEASPVGDWTVDEEKIDSVRTILAQFEPKRQAVRTMLEQWDTTRYNYIFNRHPEASSPTSEQPRTNRPFLYVYSKVDTEASKYLLDYALLEEYAIAQALLNGNIKEAIDTLADIFRIAQLASVLGNVGVRGDAAQVRLRAFDVMQRVVLDPKFDKTQMLALRDVLLYQHEHWTSEYIAWFGDRASGMMLYHQIMMNGLENALEQDELDFVEEQVGKNKFARGFRKYHEADKVFYLRSMQNILDVSEKPFVERLDVLNQINKDIRASEHTVDDNGIATEHFVANLLLRNVEPLMRVFAQDQSALNRAIVAIHISLGQRQLADRFRDPFTDEPYEVQKVEGRFSVSTTMLPRPFRVPDFTSEE